MKILYSNILLLSIIPILYISVFFKSMSKKPMIKVTKEESSFTMNKELLYYFSMGNRRLISSFLWSYTLLESDTEHFNNKDGNSWMFNRFNTIAILDKQFYENYLFGGQYLSIIKDDILGAEIIYNLGLIAYPDDFFINFNAGFNYFFELHNISKAFKLFKKIQYYPVALKAAPYLPSLVAKISVQEENLESAFLLLSTTYEKTKNKALKNKYRVGLYAIKAEIDLKCLNSNIIKNCAKKDFNGTPYLKQGNTYIALEKWVKFKVHTKKRNRGEAPPSP